MLEKRLQRTEQMLSDIEMMLSSMLETIQEFNAEMEQLNEL